MSRLTRRFGCAAAVAVLSLAPGALGQAYQNLTEEVGRGFGSTWNRYAWSMTEFQGQEYVGTWNVQANYVNFAKAILSGQVNLQDILDGKVDLLSLTGLLSSTGGEIWRREGGQQWTQVHKSSPQEMGFRHMTVHEGTLYAASANYAGGSRILSSANGTDWAPLAGGPMNDPANTSIRTMLSHQGQLYVGTENPTGAELWAYNPAASTWTQKGVFAQDSAVGELAVYNGKMYVGTWDFQEHYRLHASSDTENWQDVTPVFAGSQDLHNFGVMQLREFGGQLYLGTVNYFEGFTLLRSGSPDSPGSWEVITTDGMGNPDNAYTWSGAVWDGKFYIGTFNHGIRGGVYSPLLLPLDGRGQLLASEDGVNLTTVIPDGFGSPFTYGIRTLLVNEDNELICGTASNFLLVDLLNNPTIPGINPADLQKALLEALGPERLAELMRLLGSQGYHDWIGCEVYAIPQAPEPATLVLLCGGMVGLLLCRRRPGRLHAKTTH